jgi:hypothetical protein
LHVFSGGRGPSPAPPEILAEEDAADGAGEEAEEGPDAEEQCAGQSADEASYGAAGRAPLARPEPASPVGRAKEVSDEGNEGEEAQEDDDQRADHLEARNVGVDEGGGEYQGHAR